MSSFKNSDLLLLAKYFIDQNDTIISDQVRCDVNRLWILFQAFIKDVEPLSNQLSMAGNMSEFLLQFDEVSGSALEWSRPVDSYRTGSDTSHILTPRLLSVNMSKIRILYNTSNSFVLESKKAIFARDQENLGSTSSRLLRALDGPTYTTVRLKCENTLMCNAYHQDYESLTRILERKTAQPQLSKKRAKLRTVEKAFHEICSDRNHSKQIVNLITNVKGHQQILYPRGKSNEANFKVQQLIQECRNMISEELIVCSQQNVHYLPIVGFHTDPNLGDCSYLDTCHKMRTCRYLHYFTLSPTLDIHPTNIEVPEEGALFEYTIGDCFSENMKDVLPAQWIKCDVRYLPFSILGKFAAIISDPPWNIHMSLPYGTCKDHELLKLSMRELQDEGIILLWVTGRSIDIGRKALVQWGYRVANEMIWVKLNQLRRTIVTGRTGHWLNHSKEHLLVGIKGNPPWINRLMDLDIIVSGTRETSRKPDELYELVERIVGKHARKLEMFGRDHNIRPGWMTIGNQLSGTSLYEQEVAIPYTSYIQETKANAPAK